MGKSMRSKRKQKLKRERKEKFKVKEVKRLKDMLRAAGEDVDGTTEAVMTDAETLKARKAASRPAPLADGEEAMEVTKAKPQFHPVTLRNEHGNYPVWMNRRQIKRHKKLTSKNAAEGYTKGKKRKKL
ncbi:protein LLP-like [Pollicipes pollicipes]|uniref:protein LLP-like n=1 Tax=Pollicipes pollicipes TaxID=41117 RepID=UPI0018854341|nr:protein LLP-like [Pollicipes pollicipes]